MFYKTETFFRLSHTLETYVSMSRSAATVLSTSATNATPFAGNNSVISKILLIAHNYEKRDGSRKNLISTQ